MRKYKKMSKLINNTGYTPGTSSESNPVNYIPSEDITMRNTPYPLYGQPLDQFGNAIAPPTYMEPGQEYKFGGASYVAEVPVYKDGGQKSAWISEKIATLIGEGRPQKQAIAIAYSMWNQKHEMGGMQSADYYQIGGEKDKSNYEKEINAGYPNFGDQGTQTPNSFNFKPNPQIGAPLNLNTNIEPWKYGLGQDPNYVSPLSTDSLTAGKDWAAKNPLPEGVKQPMATSIGFEPMSAMEMSKGVQNAKVTNDGGASARTTTGITQFYNPYGGIGIGDALTFSGEQFAKGNKGLGIAGAAAGVLEGTKAFLSGMGAQKRQNQVMKNYAEEQRKNMTGEGREVAMAYGGYYQDGGMDKSNYEEEVNAEMDMSYPQFGPQNISEDRVTTDWYEKGMDKDTYYGFKNQLESEGYKSIPKPNELLINEEDSDKWEKEYGDKASNYDKNSARDTWVAKTGMPWSEAKRLGYTDGTAKDNIKLLSELKDPRFKAENLRKAPVTRKAVDKTTTKKTYTQEELWGKPLVNPIEDYVDNLRKGKSQKPKVIKKDPTVLNREQIMEQYKDVNPLFTNNPFQAYSYKTRGYYQDGGMQPEMAEEQMMMEDSQQAGGDQMQAIAQEVAGMLQQGVDPQEILQQLVQAGLPEEQAMQVIQMVMEQMQGSQPQATPQLGRGGEMIKRADGSYSKRGLWDNIRDNAGSGKAPTKEMLEQESKIKAKYQTGGKSAGMTQAELNSLAKKYNVTPSEFLKIIKEGEGTGSMIRYEGGNTNIPKNYLESYREEQSSIPNTIRRIPEMMKKTANKGLDYLGIDYEFNNGGYYRDGSEPKNAGFQALPEDVKAKILSSMEDGGMYDMEEYAEGGTIPERYKNAGFTKVGAKKQSTRPGKKWMVLAKKGDQYKIVHGGDDSMKDFSQHGSKDRKENFWNRMGGRDSAKANDPFSPLYWHKKFGTWQEGGEIEEEDDEMMQSENPQQEQIEDQVAAALQQGADPQEILQQLVEMGMPEQEAIQMIQYVMQELQGEESEMEEPDEDQEMMKNGGEYLAALKGKKIKNYTYNKNTGNYDVELE